MLSPSIATVFLAQQRLFRRLISMAFTLAGTYWIIIYAMRFANAISEEEIAVLRVGQTLPYFVLLTLWGVEHLRNARRLQSVISRANTMNVAPQRVELRDLGSQMGRFAVIRPLAGRSWMPVTMNIVGLVVGYFLIIQQYHALLSVFVMN